MKKEIEEFLEKNGFVKMKSNDSSNMKKDVIYAKYLGNNHFAVAVGEGDGVLFQLWKGVEVNKRCVYQIEEKDVEAAYKAIIGEDKDNNNNN